MLRLLALFALRLVACAGLGYLLWRAMGAVGLVVSAPVFGIALARPLLELLGAAYGVTKRLAYRELQGQHFEFHSRRMTIVQDDEGERWLNLEDVRQVIAALPRVEVLQLQFPHGVRPAPQSKGHLIAARALVVYLAKSTEGDSLRFRHWLQREVLAPVDIARRQRGGA